MLDYNISSNYFSMNFFSSNSHISSDDSDGSCDANKNLIKDSDTDEVFWQKDYNYYQNLVENKKYMERMRKEMIQDLIDGFCSSDDTIRIDNMCFRWKISRRNAAELITNFELQQSKIDSTWV